MSERDALLWLYLYFVFVGGTDAEIIACGRQSAPLGTFYAGKFIP